MLCDAILTGFIMEDAIAVFLNTLAHAQIG